MTSSSKNKIRKPIWQHLHDYFFPHKRNNYRPHIFSIVSIVVLVLVVIVFEAGYLVQTRIVFLRTNFLASVLPGTLIALTNQDRATIGIAGVTEDQLLNKAAQAAAADMAANGYFAHVSPDGKTPWYWLDSVGYKYSYAGENLAVNFTDSSNVEMAWMNSPTHRANIEKPQYTKIGIGTANGMYEGAETTFVVQFFAAPATPTAEQVTPAHIALATSPATEQTSTSTSTAKVLGTETTPTSPSLSAPVSIGWFAFLLTSPLHTITGILTILFVVIIALFAIAILVRGKVQHPTVVIGGTVLLVVIAGAILISSTLAGKVQLPVNSQAASVGATMTP